MTKSKWLSNNYELGLMSLGIALFALDDMALGKKAIGQQCSAEPELTLWKAR